MAAAELAKDKKNNKGFYRYVSQKSKVKASLTHPDEHDWKTSNKERGEG